MTKTCVIHDVTPADKDTVVAGLRLDGYNTFSYPEPDGNYTVIGTKEVPDSNNPAPAAATAPAIAVAKVHGAAKAAKPG